MQSQAKTMITNLIATITILLTTNVVETYGDYEAYTPTFYPESWAPQTKGVNPRLKTVTTTVTRSKVLTFDWDGRQRVIEEPEDTHVMIQHFRIKPGEWIPAEKFDYRQQELVATNTVWPATNSFTVTTNRLIDVLIELDKPKTNSVVKPPHKGLR